MVDALAADDKPRTEFMKACLTKLGLQVNQDAAAVPSLSSLHVSAADPSDISKLLAALEDVISRDGSAAYLRDDNDTFLIERANAPCLAAEEEHSGIIAGSDSAAQEGLVDYDAIVKRLVIHDDVPSSKSTPFFNHHAFYSSLRGYRSQSSEGASAFGSQLLYGEVVTSTNTILEKCGSCVVLI